MRMSFSRSRSLAIVAGLLLPFFVNPAMAQTPAAARKPNIIFILADDLGYGDLGCYGQQKIKTPNLDKMAAQGLRFKQVYAGSTVCAPSRCALMTGKNTGHCRIRGNLDVPLEAKEITIATLLKSLGYATGLVGKWGLGEPGTTGVPNRQGFDYFFGFLNQNHAHNYYPDYLWRNETKVPLPNVVVKGVATKRVVYATDLFTKEALEFIEKNKAEPFFLYLAYTAPHANNQAGKQGMEVPSDEPYSKETWPQAQKNHAAMITRMDRDIGKLFDKLRELGIDENTIVFFASDNGPHQEGGGDPYYFSSAGVLRGFKRSLHEGGIRIPMIVRWPGKVSAGSESDLVWAFWDVLPTVAELTGARTPAGLDGLSVAPTILSKGTQKQHDFLYWEFHEGGFKQGVRMGDWKAVREKIGTPLELYDLKKDISEKTNIAKDNPEIIRQIEAYLAGARTESEFWPVGKGKK
jgi:arylsulfatase A-like enzyme